METIFNSYFKSTNVTEPVNNGHPCHGPTINGCNREVAASKIINVWSFAS